MSDEQTAADPDINRAHHRFDRQRRLAGELLFAGSLDHSGSLPPKPTLQGRSLLELLGTGQPEDLPLLTNWENGPKLWLPSVVHPQATLQGLPHGKLKLTLSQEIPGYELDSLLLIDPLHLVRPETALTQEFVLPEPVNRLAPDSQETPAARRSQISSMASARTASAESAKQDEPLASQPITEPKWEVLVDPHPRALNRSQVWNIRSWTVRFPETYDFTGDSADTRVVSPDGRITLRPHEPAFLAAYLVLEYENPSDPDHPRFEERQVVSPTISRDYPNTKTIEHTFRLGIGPDELAINLQGLRKVHIQISRPFGGQTLGDQIYCPIALEPDDEHSFASGQSVFTGDIPRNDFVGDELLEERSTIFALLFVPRES